VVKALLAKGATASIVAREMGIGRNAALGRIYRDPEMALVGWHHRPKPKLQRPPRQPKPKQPSSPKPAVAAMVTVTGDVVQSICAPVAPPPAPKPALAHPMALIGTGRRWCKWPVAADSRVLGGFLCCGCRSLPGDVYCAEHREKAARVRL
jgi:hypothetical protein